MPRNPLCGWNSCILLRILPKIFVEQRGATHAIYKENEDVKWIRSNYELLQEKYSDMYIAVFKKKVIAASNSFKDMREMAKSISEHFVISQMIGESRVL